MFREHALSGNSLHVTTSIYLTVLAVRLKLPPKTLVSIGSENGNDWKDM